MRLSFNGTVCSAGASVNLSKLHTGSTVFLRYQGAVHEATVASLRFNNSVAILVLDNRDIVQVDLNSTPTEDSVFDTSAACDTYNLQPSIMW